MLTSKPFQLRITRNVTKGCSEEVVPAGTVVWLHATRKHESDPVKLALVSIKLRGSQFSMPMDALERI